MDKPNVYKRGNKFVSTVRWDCPENNAKASVSRSFDTHGRAEVWGEDTLQAINKAIRTGRYHREDFIPREKKKADEARKEAIQTARAKIPTLGEALQFYLESLENKESKSARSEKYRVVKWQRRSVSEKLICDVTPDDIVEVRDELVKAGKSESTIHNEFTCVSNTFKICMGKYTSIRKKWTGIPNDLKNPVQILRDEGKFDKTAGIPRPAPQDYRKVRINKEQEQIIYNQLLEQDLEIACAFKIAIETGMRQGEIFALQKSWLRLDEKRVDLPKEFTKTKKDRMVGLTDVAVEMIKTVIKNPDRKEVTGKRWTKYIEPNNVFTCSKEHCHDHFSRARKILSLEYPEIAEIHWHDLKHEACSRLILAGWPIPLVMKQTGNKTFASMQRYINMQDTEVLKAIAKLDEQRTL